jgi:hypothetical protein
MTMSLFVCSLITMSSVLKRQITDDISEPMTTHIARRLERLEERLAISDDTPRIQAIFNRIVRPSPNGPDDDVQAAKLEDGTILYRGPNETLEDFESRIHQSLPPFTGRIPHVLLGLPQDFSNAEPVSVLNR